MPADVRNSRLREYAKVRINHPRLREVRQTMIEIFEDNDPAAIVLVPGPSGVGKTSLLESVRKAIGSRCVYLEARGQEGRAYDNKEHCRLLLEELGDPAPDDHFDPEAAAARRRAGKRRPAVGRRATLSDLRLALERTLRQAAIECVIIDEGQHLLNGATGDRLLRQMDFIKSMSNLSGSRHVIAGTPDLLSVVKQSPQLRRRSRVVRFPAYRADRERDSIDFLATFRALVDRLPLERQANLAAETDYVFATTAGCIGELKDWLYRALARALREGLQSIDGDVLRRTALDSGNEHEIAADAGPPERTGETGTAVVPQAPEGKSPKVRRPVGQREPSIDPVGHQTMSA